MKKIWQRITGETWCQGTYARNCYGEPVSRDSEHAVSWCAIGWIRESYSILDWQKEDKFRDVIDAGSIAEWNDDPKRNFSEVRAAFKKANL